MVATEMRARNTSPDLLPTTGLHDGTILEGNKALLFNTLLRHISRESALPTDLVDVQFFSEDPKARDRTHSLIQGLKRSVEAAKGTTQMTIVTVDDPEVKRRRGISRSSVFLFVPPEYKKYYGIQESEDGSMPIPREEPKAEPVPVAEANLPEPTPARTVDLASQDDGKSNGQIFDAATRGNDRIGKAPKIKSKDLKAAQRYSLEELERFERSLPDTDAPVPMDRIPGGKMVLYNHAVASGQAAHFDPDNERITARGLKAAVKTNISLWNQRPDQANLAQLHSTVRRTMEQ